MEVALSQARAAGAAGEVPVGAVLIRTLDGDSIELARARNETIARSDPTAHAEILALRDAGTRLKNYRLPHTTLYVTIEPCTMCVGALVHARIDRLVFGALEPKAGAVVSHPTIRSERFNHRVDHAHGVLAEPCGALMTEFFAARRSGAGGTAHE